jgi:hypothetical protein
MNHGRATAIGAALAAAHAAGFAALAARCGGDELAIGVAGPPAAPTLALDASLPAGLAARIAIDDTPGPGLHRRRWTVRYRGGIERSVGAVQLVGPFQDPDAGACIGRVVVGQRLLDDGHAGPGTIAAAMLRELEAELRGMTVFPAGDLVRIERFALRWAELARHPEDGDLLRDALDDAADSAPATGYVRASATLVFERVTVPVIVALVPAASRSELRFRTSARAELAFDNGALQWLSDRLGGNFLATRVARHQIDDAIVTALAPPPPFPLPGGQTLRFTYCDQPAAITEASHGALPFGLALGRARDPRILPPRLGPGPRRPPPAATQLALDLDLDALNAVLYELWRTGLLDRRLAAAGLDRRFNTDPTVTALLSLRIAPPVLTLPPVVTAVPGGLRLSAEAALAIRDGTTTADGRLWGGLDFRLAPSAIEPIAVDLGDLELSCQRPAPPAPATAPAPDRAAAPAADRRILMPCYSDLVAALRGRAGELHGALTASFVQLLSDIFVGRLTASGVAADLVIRGAAPSVAVEGSNATLHLSLDAAIAPR